MHRVLRPASSTAAAAGLGEWEAVWARLGMWRFLASEPPSREKPSSVREALSRTTSGGRPGGGLPTGISSSRNRGRNSVARPGDEEEAPVGSEGLFSPADALEWAEAAGRDPASPEMDFLRNLHDLSLSGYAQRSAATVQQQAEMYLAVAAWKETHPDYNPVLGHPMEHKTKPKSSAARLEERKSVLMRELNIETEADWEEAKRLAIGAYKEWQQEQKAARRESGDSAKDMVAQREEIEALIDAFPGNREAERYLRGVAHVVMRNHTMPHRSRVAMMKFSVQNIKALGTFGVPKEGESSIANLGTAKKTWPGWPKDGTPI